MHKPGKKLARPPATLLAPAALTVAADLLTPVSAFLKVAAGKPGACLLESVAGSERLARFSIIAFEPEFRFVIEQGIARIEGEGPACDPALLAADPLAVLQDILAARKFAPIPGIPALAGGAIGYAGFDFARVIEPKLPRRDKPAPPGHDLALAFYRKFLVFDHLHHEIRILVLPKENLPAARAMADALNEVRELAGALHGPVPPQTLVKNSGEPAVESSFSEAAFKQAVRRAQAAIRAGDAYQIVLSQQFRFSVTAAPFAIYRALRRVNPSPYMYYLELPEGTIVGASPEMLLRCEKGALETVPIAGTRPRGKDDAEDAALALALLNDPKELSEHRMLVDLGRNDLGRVSEYGSVEVAELLKIEKYSHVMHLVSRVTGRLAKNRSALDALRAVFPAGTLSGAPKFRALELIDELEPVRRGLYGGAILHLSSTGDLDSCIAIRTLFINNGVAWGQAGAGIVYDSNPAAEYRECMQKFCALQRAVAMAGETTTR